MTMFSSNVFHRWTIAAPVLTVPYSGNGFYRSTTADLWAHLDQAIPVKALHTRGDLDTDWTKTELPEYYRIHCYNFSGYLVTAYAVMRLSLAGFSSMFNSIPARMLRTYTVGPVVCSSTHCGARRLNNDMETISI